MPTDFPIAAEAIRSALCAIKALACAGVEFPFEPYLQSSCIRLTYFGPTASVAGNGVVENLIAYFEKDHSMKTMTTLLTLAAIAMCRPELLKHKNST